MTEDEIRQVRAEYKLDEKGKAVNIIELAKHYGVSQETIRKIAKGKIYVGIK